MWREVETDLLISANKPDMVIYDHKKQTIEIIEVGITSINNLISTDYEKYKKYDKLANALAIKYKYKVKIISYAITWDKTI